MSTLTLSSKFVVFLGLYMNKFGSKADAILNTLSFLMKAHTSSFSMFDKLLQYSDAFEKHNLFSVNAGMSCQSFTPTHSTPHIASFENGQGFLSLLSSLSNLECDFFK